MKKLVIITGSSNGLGKSLVEVFLKENFNIVGISRTNDFMAEFAKELSGFDTTILLDIYPAREKPIEGVTSAVLAQLMTNKVSVLSKEATLDWVAKQSFDVLLTLGAGDIDRLIPNIKKLLS